MPLFLNKSNVLRLAQCHVLRVFIIMSWLLSQLLPVIYSQEFMFESEIIPYQNADSLDQYFGTSIDLEGDLAVVGAPEYNHGRGCVYVLEYNGLTWDKVATLTVSDGHENDNFGISVKIEGEIIVAGAVGRYPDREIPGYVCLFEKPETGWTSMTEDAKLTASDGANNDLFGFSLDINKELVVVGAYGADVNDLGDGAVYIFEKPENGWISMTESCKISREDGSMLETFGSNVLITDNEIFIRANKNRGEVYVYNKPVGNWQEIKELAKLTASESFNVSHFGWVIHSVNDVLIIGAPGIAVSRGFTFIFEKPENGWRDTTETYVLTSSKESFMAENFGISVAVSNNLIIVGATKDNSYQKAESSVYIFTKPVTGWTKMTENYKLPVPDGVSYENQFGSSIAMSGDKLLVVEKINNPGRTGKLYFYKKNASGIEKVSDDGVHVYPNPASSIVNIKVPGQNKIRLKLLNVTGSVVIQTGLVEPSTMLDLSGYKNGIYLLKIEAGNNVFLKRIVKK